MPFISPIRSPCHGSLGQETPSRNLKARGVEFRRYMVSSQFSSSQFSRSQFLSSQFQFLSSQFAFSVLSFSVPVLSSQFSVPVSEIYLDAHILRERMLCNLELRTANENWARSSHPFLPPPLPIAPIATQAVSAMPASFCSPMSHSSGPSHPAPTIAGRAPGAGGPKTSPLISFRLGQTTTFAVWLSCNLTVATGGGRKMLMG